MKSLFVKCAAAAMLLALGACTQDETKAYIEKVQQAYQDFQDKAATGCKIVPSLAYVGPAVDAIFSTGGSATVIAAAIKAGADKFCEYAMAPSTMRTLLDSGEVMTDRGPVKAYRLTGETRSQ